MNIEALNERYQALREDGQTGKRLRPMTLAQLDGPHVQSLASLAETREALESFVPTQGWCTQQSADSLWLENPWQLDDSAGQILAFEAINAKGDALHLRRSAGGWSLVRFGCETGEELLSDEVSFIARHEAVSRVRYRRYWRAGSATAPTAPTAPCAVCFIGFDVAPAAKVN